MKAGAKCARFHFVHTTILRLTIALLLAVIFMVLYKNR